MNHYQFYLSYTNKDRELANRIEKLLIENGFTVYNPISCLEPMLSYARQLVSAISSCDYFIPIVTDNYSRSDHVLNEIDLAFKGLPNRIKFKPLRLDEAELAPSFNYYLSRQPLNWDILEQQPILDPN